MISLEAVKNYHCPRWEEMPTVPLYMDQVVMIVTDALSIFAEEGEPIITSTMINNYVKHKMIDPSVKKKYTKNHLASLIVLSLFKKVFSMNEISSVIDIIVDAYGIEHGYNMFCDKLEDFLLTWFSSEEIEIKLIRQKDNAEDVLQVAMITLVGKVLVQSQLPAPKKETNKGKK